LGKAIGSKSSWLRALWISADVAEGLSVETLWWKIEGTMLLDSSHLRPFKDR
jgi:hypothetical protein